MPLQLEGGHHPGPLFISYIRKLAKRDLHKSGWIRRKTEYDRTPEWADKDAVAAIYLKCKKLNKQDGARSWAVDHIVPLNHPAVCGFHVAVNLQIIRYNENSQKSNNFWPDMWNIQMDLFGGDDALD